ncbi:hypothetical protein [Agrococcus baldri]|uniref:Glycine zipper-like domain-containing protein n=1 Tax=Agrococcus baldri TaxID=153730 RepID=A0AA87UR66_9MICO|nr:hypothetical protein [Agrococcus baldri]GEK79199.1 hypothetical protein ABA31_05500 [Agrococcus baldri]
MAGKRNEYASMGVCVAIGIAIGAAIGVAQDNLSLWMGVGGAIGIALGAAFGVSGTRDEGEGESPRPPAE